VVGHIRIIVIGNVGTDPEMRYTAQGVAVTRFRLASTRNANSPSGERQQETEWFTVVSFRQLAEQVNQFLTKGRRAYVEGRLQSRTFEGNDGRTRFVNEIIADRVLFLDRQGERPTESGESSGAAGHAEAAVEVDDLPF
jgi:single-strand DNA-binding protein